MVGGAAKCPASFAFFFFFVGCSSDVASTGSSYSVLTAMSSSDKPPLPPRRTHDANKLKEIVAELRLCRFVLDRGEQEMRQLDEHDTQTRRTHILSCLTVAKEGLRLVEQMADHIVTDISGYAVHQVWETSVLERHRAEHGSGPPRLMPQHHWLITAEAANKFKTNRLLWLGREASERMNVALTNRRAAWRAAKPADAAAAPAAAAAATAAAATTPTDRPSKRGPAETAVVVRGTEQPALIKRSRRVQHLSYPRPEGKFYMTQGDVCVALDAAIEGLTDPVVCMDKLYRVKQDMVENGYVAMGVTQLSKWYHKWRDPAMRHLVSTTEWVMPGRRTLLTVGGAQTLFAQRAGTGEKVKGQVFHAALTAAANQALNDAGLASKPEVRTVGRLCWRQ